MRLTEEEYLLDENYVVLEKKGPNLEKDKMRNIIKQRTNKKILGFLRFHLWVHNVANNGKDTKFRNWLMESVGEPPVVHDSILTRRATEQLHLYLVKKGYFENGVRDSIVLDHKKQRAEVYYKIRPGPPYRIRNLHYQVEDPAIGTYVSESRQEALIDSNDVFDIDRLDDERERLTEYLRYRGYYYFTKEYIRFRVDSAVHGNYVDVDLVLENPRQRLPEYPDSVRVEPHRKYKIREVRVNTEYSSYEKSDVEYDTLRYRQGFTFLYRDNMKYDPDILLSSTFLKPGDIYRNENESNTYRRLSELRSFKSVNIRFESAEVDTGGHWLDCTIMLSPAKKQSFSIETRGTNQGGNLGISGNVSYKNKNVFRGAETFQVDLNGGVESQKTLTEEGERQGVVDDLSFNTIEIGPEISLNFPRFLLPVNPTRFALSADPSTRFSTSYNFQRRPDYTRSITKLSLSYQWNDTRFKRHRIEPVELSSISIDKSDAFQDRLDHLNDQLLLNSYQDHLILSSRYTFTYNSQRSRTQENVFFYRGNAELAGNLLRGILAQSGVEVDEDDSYRIFNIKFAQFIRVDNDLRYYRRINNKSSFAYRFVAGIGLPFQNLEVLPFQKSFFGGGANGIRAWRARTLGPGAYFDPSLEQRFDKTGDVRLETNLEYRFDLLNVLESAFFIDAGNIWLLEEDSLRPGGEFDPETFLNEVAVGAGVGLRVDLDFFIIRFDLGLQIKDPALPVGERWLFQPKEQYNNKVRAIAEQDPTLDPDKVEYSPNLNLNIGIGYPF